MHCQNDVFTATDLQSLCVGWAEGQKPQVYDGRQDQNNLRTGVCAEAVRGCLHVVQDSEGLAFMRGSWLPH